MAKMFYTLDEAADRLKKSADEVKKMASSGQIQEFRDRDRLMFKVEQIDLLSADDDLGGGDAEVAELHGPAGQVQESHARGVERGLAHHDLGRSRSRALHRVPHPSFHHR